MSENNLKRDYPRIFLTDELCEVNWCQDRITAEDVEYVPVSALLAAQAEVTRLREILTKIRHDPMLTLRVQQVWEIDEALAPKEPS